ncbi:DNA primase [Pokkaliibacter sp. CJK22405]|uniref:DNA primase n=1 Tax=Pokkaliibacter sp. CJK22405 TaxID=3384615 RepID=UPI003985502E
MAGKIPQSFIDDLLARTDIVDIVDERVALKKTGKNYSACCPFHQEKSPSFTVSPDKQFYYCFGCGASGNALGFIMEYDRLEFRAAIESLAKRNGMEIPEQAGGHQAEEDLQTPLFNILEDVAQWYAEQLKSHSHRDKAVQYLKNRGLNGRTAAAFRIGFAPAGWDNVLKTFGTSEVRKQQLIDAGLLIDKPDEGRCYDRFRDRIMFPIRNAKGKVIGFGGRVLNNEKPKYLNSPETPVFHKNQELYGFFEARRFGKKIERYLIVEGYMDVVMLAQYGLHEAVATLGTATSESHIRQLFKRVDEIVFCFDGDNAGRTAAQRALMTVLPLMEDGRQARFLFLPEGEDPDSLIQREGLDEFQRRINRAQRFSDFLFDHLKGEDDMASAESRADLSKRALPLIEQIKPGILKQLLMDNLAALTGMDSQRLSQWSQEHTSHKTLPMPEESQTSAAQPAMDEEHYWQDQHYDAYEMEPPEPYHEDYSASFSTPAPRKFQKKGQQRKNGNWKEDKEQPYERNPQKTLRLSPCRAAILALIRSPALAQELNEDLTPLKQLEDAEVQFLLSLFEWLKEHKDAGFAELATTFDFANNASCRFLDELSDISFRADHNDDARFLQTNVVRLQIDAIAVQYAQLQEKLQKNIRLSEEEKSLYRDLPSHRLRLQQRLQGQGA